MTSGWDFLAAYSNPVPADVAGALDALGVEVRREVSRSGSAEYLARCPAHLVRTGRTDRHPSFWVNSVNGAFVCFSCGYSGPFVVLVADVLGVEREEAVRWIARRGVYRTTATDEAPPPVPEPAVTEAYLALFDPPPEHALAERRLTVEAAAEYGVLWDLRTDRWILPIREPDGRLIGWQEKGEGHFRNCPDRVRKSLTLFGPLGAETILLVESPLDAVRIAALGVPGAVAAFGAHVSEAQMQLIRRSPCRRLILALDNDTAGNGARDRLYEAWRPRGLPIAYYDYAGADGKDPGDSTDEQILRGIARAYRPWRR
ncbi:toprim domain-containing protein [Kitasatospora purpeofusca]|uniref:toprim domain-containing protein n=1 Tax=Kitasatospora purpeofusca TaxID=67352 RepID=UPI00367C221F